MASRHPRTSQSIPIPSNSRVSTSPSRNIESAISISFAPQPRHQGQAFTRSVNAEDEPRSINFHGTMAASTSPLRTTTRSFSNNALIPTRGSPRSGASFEPRIIRLDTSRSTTDVCAPSSPTRSRRISGAHMRQPSSTALKSPGGNPAIPARTVTSSFPRPSYLDHSTFRNLIHTESAPTLPPGRRAETTPLASRTSARGYTPTTDSDDESASSPLRELGPSPAVNDDSVLRLPTRWSDSMKNIVLSIGSDGRDLSYQGPSSNGEKEAAAVRTDFPAPPACGIYYYEVEIISKGTKGHISIGFASRDVKLSRLPGWEKNSWGYHGDDGFSFAAEKTGTKYGPTFGTGDIIGCGVDFSQYKAFYTVNGNLIGPVFDGIGKDIAIYPSIGLRHSGEAVRANFGQEPFRFDIESYVQKQRDVTWAKILATPVTLTILEGRNGMHKHETATEGGKSLDEDGLKGPMRALVMSYLTHHGYTKTARALQMQIERRKSPAVIPPPVPSSHPYHTSGFEQGDIDMDDASTELSSGVHADGALLGEEYTDLRIQIVNSVVNGDIDAAIEATKQHYPSVLEIERGLMLFKLKCRRFVELILAAVQLKKRMLGLVAGGAGDAGKHMSGMEVDDEAPSTVPTNGVPGMSSPSSPVEMKRKASQSPTRTTVRSPFSETNQVYKAKYEVALNEAISYGKLLQKDYGNDDRVEVRTIFKRTFGIIAWNDPAEAGGDVGEVAGLEARVALANELNQAILKSLGRPVIPPLETLYKRTAACITQLGMSGNGAAAFADIQKELLDG